jgi:hypothetical protein
VKRRVELDGDEATLAIATLEQRAAELSKMRADNYRSRAQALHNLAMKIRLA